MFVYDSRVYSMVQYNPRPKNYHTEAENIQNNIKHNFEIMLNTVMFLKCKLAYIGAN